MTAPPDVPAIPDYVFDRVLGKGGMGTVYLFRHAITRRPEVVKLLAPELLAKPGNRERFEREIRAAFLLSHPNIVAAYSTHRVGDALAFCMEYVDGDDLSRVVRQGGPLAVAEGCEYVRQAAHGLQHAHERGMVHRDIKPGNLMRTADGGRTVVKVLDFGLAKVAGRGEGEAADTTLTQHGQMLGTPDFIAPEQIRNAAGADIRSDLYSLGCTLYFLLAGRPPFKGEFVFDLFAMHLNNDAPPLDQVRPEVPAELAAVVARMMAKNPADRHQTPAEVAEALDPFAGPTPGPVSRLLPRLTAINETETKPLTPPVRTPEPTEWATDETKSAPPDQFISLSPDRFDSPPSTRVKPPRPAPPPIKPESPGWVVPAVVAGLLCVGVGAVVVALNWRDETVSPPTTAATGPTPTTERTPTTTPSTERTPTTERTATTTPTTKRKETSSPATQAPKDDGPPEVFGPKSPAPPKVLWRAGLEPQVEGGQLVAAGGVDEMTVLFDGSRLADFDLTAELKVTGGAGLIVRGERRTAGDLPTGYLLGLGQSDAPEYVAGAVHRWGHAGGARKLLATGDPAWARPGELITVRLQARGEALTATVDGRPPFRVADAQGYAGGYIGLATPPGSSVRVRRLVVEPKPSAEPSAPAEPGFRALLETDRLTGWEVQGENLNWEAIGTTLTGTTPADVKDLTGNLLTATNHADFVLRFDYWLDPGAAAMVSVRASPGLNIAHPRLLLTDPAHLGPKVLATGTLVGVDVETRPPPATTAGLAAGVWHAVELTLRGQTCKLVIDGRTVQDLSAPGDRVVKYTPGLRRTTGRVGVTAYSGTVRFRNLRVKEL